MSNKFTPEAKTDACIMQEQVCNLLPLFRLSRAPCFSNNRAVMRTVKMTLNGVKDLGGNAITGYTSAFKTFEPTSLATVEGISGAMALDKYRSSVDGKDYLVVTGAYGEEASGITVVDVSDPENPIVKGVAHTFGFDRDVKALPNVSFTDRLGTTTTGDFAVAVGGLASRIGYLNLMNVTDPANPYLYEYIYLSWSPAYSDSAPLNVPFAGGAPYRVEVLGTYAYVVNMGLGIQAIDLTKVTPIHTQAQREAIIGTITEYSYRGISKIEHGEAPAKSVILATKNHTLSIIDPGLNIKSEVTDLNLPYDVTGVTAYPLDADDDGNLGTFEDEDGDPTTSAQETFDLAFVSTLDGVVIVNVNNTSSPEKLAVIPTGGILPGKVVVNRAKRLAYVTVDDEFWAMSLKSLKELQGLVLKDTNGDLLDDRVVSVLKEKPKLDENGNPVLDANGNPVMENYGFTDGFVEMDGLGRELLYQLNSEGKVQVVDLNVPTPDFRIVAHDDPNKIMSGAVTDGAALLRLQIYAKGSEKQKMYKNLSWIISDQQVPLSQTSHKGKLLNADGIEVYTLPVTFNADGVASAVYRAPDTFVRWGEAKVEKDDQHRPERRVSAVLSGNNLYYSGYRVNILLKRPPVVLVHGLWGNGDPSNKMYAWKTFEAKFNPVDKRLFDVFSVDYFERNQARSIVEHAYKLGNKIENAFGKLKAAGFVTSKVDVIAHSMGGLLTREYCKQFGGECQEKIRRFVTIDTPHFGSELADLLLVYRDPNTRNFFSTNQDCLSTVDSFERGSKIRVIGTHERSVEPHPITPKDGAIDDLATGTLPPQLPQGLTSKGRWKDYPALSQTLSAHSIVGLTGANADGYDTEIFGLWRYIISRCGFTRVDIFGSEADTNDRIVKQTSQIGGVINQHSTKVYDTDHFSVRNSIKTIDRIRALIDEPRNSKLFTK